EAAREPDQPRAVHSVDEPLAPPAEADDCCIEHEDATPAQTDAGAPGCLSGWARANASMPWHASATRTKFGNGAVSTLKNFAPAAWLAMQMSASVTWSPWANLPVSLPLRCVSSAVSAWVCQCRHHAVTVAWSILS